jgi:hypothetical protein
MRTQNQLLRALLLLGLGPATATQSGCGGESEPREQTAAACPSQVRRGPFEGDGAMVCTDGGEPASEQSAPPLPVPNAPPPCEAWESSTKTQIAAALRAELEPVIVGASCASAGRVVVAFDGGARQWFLLGLSDYSLAPIPADAIPAPETTNYVSIPGDRQDGI